MQETIRLRRAWLWDKTLNDYYCGNRTFKYDVMTVKKVRYEALYKDGKNCREPLLASVYDVLLLWACPGPDELHFWYCRHCIVYVFKLTLYFHYRLNTPLLRTNYIQTRHPYVATNQLSVFKSILGNHHPNRRRHHPANGRRCFRVNQPPDQPRNQHPGSRCE